MSIQNITETLQKARDIHSRLDPDLGIIPSFDAVFIAVALSGATRSRVGKEPDQPPPEWLKTFVESHSGLKITIGQVLMMAGRMSISQADRKMMGRWLRALGKVPSKVGGKMLFPL